MILVDSSVWIDHLRTRNPELVAQLEWGQVVTHPAVLGELACGTFRDRGKFLSLMQQLPQIMEAEHEEVMTLIERHRLMGKGIGWIDAHLLASAILSNARLWTLDKRLAEIERRIGSPR